MNNRVLFLTWTFWVREVAPGFHDKKFLGLELHKSTLLEILHIASFMTCARPTWGLSPTLISGTTFLHSATMRLGCRNSSVGYRGHSCPIQGENRPVLPPSDVRPFGQVAERIVFSEERRRCAAPRVHGCLPKFCLSGRLIYLETNKEFLLS
jgi:hypothetical protein